MWYAIDLINPAIKRTKEFLFPFNLILWLKLAVLGFFINRPGGNLNLRFMDFTELDITQFLSSYWHLIIAGIIFLFLLGIVFSIVSSLFIFAFMKSVDKKNVKIIQYTKDNLSKGISYFLFRLIFGLLILLVFAAILLPIVIPLIKGSSFSQILAIAIPLLILFFALIVFLILFWSFIGLFVVPYMFIKDKKTLSSLSDCLKLFKREYKQMLMFFLMHFVLGMASAIILMLLFFIVLIPFIIVGLVLAALLFFFF